MLNRNQLANITPKNSDREAELLSVIILQLDFPNLQNLFTRQYFGKASTSRTIWVGILTHLNRIHPMHAVTLKKCPRNFRFKVSIVDFNRSVTILEKQRL